MNRAIFKILIISVIIHHTPCFTEKKQIAFENTLPTDFIVSAVTQDGGTQGLGNVPKKSIVTIIIPERCLNAEPSCRSLMITSLDDPSLRLVFPISYQDNHIRIGLQFAEDKLRIDKT